MELKLRQRIIGGAVLVALGIIFLPLLFKNSANTASTEPKQVTLSAQIPPAPAKPTPAPQTIVMIQNKDMSAPAASDNSTVASSSSRVPTIQSNTITPQSVANGKTLAANQQAAPEVPASVNKQPTSNNTKATTQPGQSTINQAGNSQVTPDKASQKINLVEDETLSPPGVNHSSANTASKQTNKTKVGNTQSTTKSLHANNNIKTSKKHENVEQAKHVSTTSKQVVLAKNPHEPTAKPTSATKKHTELTHHTKTNVSTINTPEAAHKKTTTTKVPVKHASSAPTQLAANQNTKVPAGVAWEVRLGSFANADNVKELVSQLRSHGFKAYTQSIHTSVGALTRVAIGPEVKREKADAIQQRLSNELHIKSEVVPFSPVAENK